MRVTLVEMGPAGSTGANPNVIALLPISKSADGWKPKVDNLHPNGDEMGAKRIVAIVIGVLLFLRLSILFSN